MLFNSFEFLLFLPIVFFSYWFIFSTRGGAEFLNRSCELSLLRMVGLAFPLFNCTNLAK